MQKLLLVAVGLVAAGGAFLWYSEGFRATSEEQPAAPIEEEQKILGEPVVVISYTEEGYEPSTVNIKKGDTVRFMNDSVEFEAWPASAVHPTHSIYPESTESDCLGSAFDACRGLKPGEFWDFRFDQVGEWRFHDHIRASQTGAVNVSE